MKRLSIFIFFFLGTLISCGESSKVQFLDKVDKSSSDDGGWSSSGGGEYHADKNNPWFLGNKTVFWCVNHGGSKSFSLDQDKAELIIANVISNFSRQIKNISDINLRTQRIVNFNHCPVNYYESDNGNIGKMHCHDTYMEPNLISESNGIKARNRGKALFLSSNFEHTENCKLADLEIILGNQNSLKIKKLKKMYGQYRFTKVLGSAMRTSYDDVLKRGKGFIYIAADVGIGRYQSDQAKNGFWNLGTNGKNNLFAGVFAHELGHVFGFKHNSKGNLMDEDFPAKIVSDGEIQNYKLDYQLRIFSNSLLPLSRKPLGIGYDIKESGPEFNGLKEWPKTPFGVLNEGTRVYLILNALENRDEPWFGKREAPYDYSFYGYIMATKYDNNNKVIEHIFETQILNYKICNPLHNVSQEQINLRANYQSKKDKIVKLRSQAMVHFWKQEVCGEALDNDGNKVSFRFTHDYFNQDSNLQFEGFSRIHLGPTRFYKEQKYGVSIFD